MSENESGDFLQPRHLVLPLPHAAPFLSHGPEEVTACASCASAGPRGPGSITYEGRSKSWWQGSAEQFPLGTVIAWEEDAKKPRGQQSISVPCGGFMVNKW